MIKNLFLKTPASNIFQKHPGSTTQRTMLQHTNADTASEMQNSTDSQNKQAKQGNTKAVCVGVLGAKGGVGASTIALNLSIALSRDGKNVTLIDGNLQQPDISIMIGQEAEHSMLEFFSRGVYEEKLFNACSLTLQTDAKQGRCSLLSAPANGEAGTESTLSDITAGLTPLLHKNEFVVVDLPKNLDKHLVTIMDKLDLIVLVYESNLASVAACRRWLKFFIELGYESDKTVMVQNRAGAHGSVNDRDSQQLLPSTNRVKIPNAYSLIESSAASGQAAVTKSPTHKYSLAIFELAKSLHLHAVGQNKND